jgi:hypothetical protein
VRVYVTTLPWTTEAGPVFEIERSEPCGCWQVTVVFTVELWLLLGFGSVEDAETEAAFWIVVPLQDMETGTLKETLNPRCCPLVRLKLSQRTFAPFCTQCVSDCAALKLRPEGIGSAMTIFVAVPGPAFKAVRTYVTTPP